MTATAEKTNPYDLLSALPDEELADLLESQRQRRASVAEKIIFDHIAAGEFAEPSINSIHVRHKFNAQELAVLDSLGFTNDAEGKQKLAREIGRLRVVVELQASAGTCETRAAVRERLAAANDELDRRGPQIEQQLLALEQELAGMKRAVSEAEREVLTREQAVEQLRDKAPAWRQEQFQHAKTRLKSELRNADLPITAEHIAELRAEHLSCYVR